jgi:hypothetical protein
MLLDRGAIPRQQLHPVTLRVHRFIVLPASSVDRTHGPRPAVYWHDTGNDSDNLFSSRSLMLLAAHQKNKFLPLVCALLHKTSYVTGINKSISWLWWQWTLRKIWIISVYGTYIPTCWLGAALWFSISVSLFVLQRVKLSSKYIWT